MHRLAIAALNRRDFDRARGLSEESLDLSRRVKRRKGEGMVLSNLGHLEWEAGNREVALQQMCESAAIAGEVGFLWWRVGSLYDLTEWELELGRREGGDDRS